MRAINLTIYIQLIAEVFTQEVLLLESEAIFLSKSIQLFMFSMTHLDEISFTMDNNLMCLNEKSKDSLRIDFSSL